MPLCPFRELKRTQLNNAVRLRAVSNIDAFINGKAGDLPKIMVGVRTDRTDTVRGKSNILRVFAVGLAESVIDTVFRSDFRIADSCLVGNAIRFFRDGFSGSAVQR